MMIEETAKLYLYCKQFGGELAVIPPEWVERLASVASFNLARMAGPKDRPRSRMERLRRLERRLGREPSASCVT
jgi:hypothetical protein